MSNTTTYGAILAGLGVFCGVIAFGLNYQADLIEVNNISH
jgi:hypothetical protein